MISNITPFTLLGLTLIPSVLYIIYFLLAKKFDMYDLPIGRSSHTKKTITGIGMVFILSFTLIAILFDVILPMNFWIGLMVLSIISFADDIFKIKHSYRFAAQIVAMILLVTTIPIDTDNHEVFSKLPIWVGAAAFGILVINGFNFMDGINGMLGLNAFVILLSFLYLNNNLFDEQGHLIQFADNTMILSLIFAVGIFLFLNLRRTSLAFMGDIGSVGISFIIIYLMYMLISQTGNISYLLLFSVLGIDSGLTVIYKLIMQENIFIPHRDFLFKKLVHIGKFGHVRISVIYALIQAFINVMLITIPFNKSVYTQVSLIFIVIILEIFVFINTRNKFSKTRISDVLSKHLEK